jgi:MOB kinase activator 1
MYHAHFRSFVRLGIDSHINRCFTRYVLFVLEFGLVDQRELQPLQKLLAFINKSEPAL